MRPTLPVGGASPERRKPWDPVVLGLAARMKTAAVASPANGGASRFPGAIGARAGLEWGGRPTPPGAPVGGKAASLGQVRDSARTYPSVKKRALAPEVVLSRPTCC